MPELKVHPKEFFKQNSHKVTTFEFNSRNIFALEIEEPGYKKVLIVPISEINKNEVSYLSRQIIDNLFVTKIDYYTYNRDVVFMRIHLNSFI